VQKQLEDCIGIMVAVILTRFIKMSGGMVLVLRALAKLQLNQCY
jgi:hypothetical protein